MCDLIEINSCCVFLVLHLINAICISLNLLLLVHVLYPLLTLLRILVVLPHGIELVILLSGNSLRRFCCNQSGNAGLHWSSVINAGMVILMLGLAGLSITTQIQHEFDGAHCICIPVYLPRNGCLCSEYL